MDPNGFEFLTVFDEAGALYDLSNNCEGNRYCAFDPDVHVMGNTGFPPLVLGLNAAPDRISGTIPVFGSVSLGSDAQMAQLDVYVAWGAVAFAGVVPEPNISLLLLSGLLVVVGMSSMKGGLNRRTRHS